MKVITQHICPPIPVRCADWAAWFDGKEEDGPCGLGSTKEEALQDLFDQSPDIEHDIAVVLTLTGKDR
jgi:hypothetical protein